MITFNFANFSFIQKVDIKCPESRKIFTTQYKFCLMEVDAKRPGGERGKAQCGNLWTRGRRGQKLENLTNVLYGSPLTQKYQLLTYEASTITIFLPELLITSTVIVIVMY